MKSDSSLKTQEPRQIPKTVYGFRTILWDKLTGKSTPLILNTELLGAPG